ncbi:hypothetical protein DPMN_009559 [Dreissena polymorpha]|uniref:TTF-type domain-containing protein n=1 Tax=Dreissena polymorpha TaxID=45954 RepID=A0A9D4N1F8_DREPO|nr:hypothetical protein DPMN_009559 [Dreissena polymorpha]
MNIPNQPRNFAFPKRTFGKKKPVQRSFQFSWFESFTWLHYNESRDLAFCYFCMTAKKTGKIGHTKVDGPAAPIFGGYLRLCNVRLRVSV